MCKEEKEWAELEEPVSPPASSPSDGPPLLSIEDLAGQVVGEAARSLPSPAPPLPSLIPLTVSEFVGTEVASRPAPTLHMSGGGVCSTPSSPEKKTEAEEGMDTILKLLSDQNYVRSEPAMQKHVAAPAPAMLRLNPDLEITPVYRPRPLDLSASARPCKRSASPPTPTSPSKKGRGRDSPRRLAAGRTLDCRLVLPTAPDLPARLELPGGRVVQLERRLLGPLPTAPLRTDKNIRRRKAKPKMRQTPRREANSKQKQGIPPSPVGKTEPESPGLETTKQPPKDMPTLVDQVLKEAAISNAKSGAEKVAGFVAGTGHHRLPSMVCRPASYLGLTNRKLQPKLSV